MLSPAWKKMALMGLGLIALLLLLEAGFRLVGFVQSSLEEYGNLQSAKQKGTYRILCLGDSTTHMQYPLFLEQILNASHAGVHFSVIDKGRGGTNPLAIVNRVEFYLSEYQPDMVVAMMGNYESGFGPVQERSAEEGGILQHSLIYRFVRMRFLYFLEMLKRSGRSHPPSIAGPPKASAVLKKANPSNAPLPGEESRPDFSVTKTGFPQSEEALEKAILTDPENGKAYAALEKLYRLQGKVFRAEDYFKKAVELDPKNDKAYVGLGRTYLIQDQLAPAEETFKKALELNPQNVNAYVGLGYLYQKKGVFTQAEDAFKKALAVDPGNNKAFFGLGKLYGTEGGLSRVEDFYREAIRKNPANDKAYFELGRLYKNQGKLTEAEEAYQKAAEIDPKNDKAYAGLAQLYKDRGKLVQAEQAYRKALEINPDNDWRCVELGRIYEFQDKLPQAENMLKRAIEINPKNNTAYIVLERIYSHQGKDAEANDVFTKAEDFFKKAIVMNPGDDESYAALGEIYQKRGLDALAEDLFEKAIQHNPANIISLIGLGIIYRDQGKFSQAEDLFKKAVSIDPGTAPERALRALASLSDELGKPDRVQAQSLKTAMSNSEDYPLVTVNSFQKLKRILDQKKIKLVCVQYPMRKLAPLKRIFENDQGVIFVDNEKVFKEAVKRSGYKEYFRDRSSDDFGHCTSKGNTLLAQNIAHVILTEVFHVS